MQCLRVQRCNVISFAIEYANKYSFASDALSGLGWTTQHRPDDVSGEEQCHGCDNYQQHCIHETEQWVKDEEPHAAGCELFHDGGFTCICAANARRHYVLYSRSA